MLFDRDMWLSYAKEIVNIFCRLSTMHERDSETGRPQNSKIDHHSDVMVMSSKMYGMNRVK